MLNRLALIFGFCIFLSSCTPLDVIKAVVPTQSAPLLNVDTQVGDKTLAVGSTQQIKTNQGTAISHDQYLGQTMVVQQDTPESKILLYIFLGFLGGFMIGWPIPGTPQKIIGNLFKRKKSPLSKAMQKA